MSFSFFLFLFCFDGEFFYFNDFIFLSLSFINLYRCTNRIFLFLNIRSSLKRRWREKKKERKKLFDNIKRDRFEIELIFFFFKLQPLIYQIYQSVIEFNPSWNFQRYSRRKREYVMAISGTFMAPLQVPSAHRPETDEMIYIVNARLRALYLHLPHFLYISR